MLNSGAGNIFLAVDAADGGPRVHQCPETVPFVIGMQGDVRELDVTTGDGVGDLFDLFSGEWRWLGSTSFLSSPL